jgi:nucleoid-associated protein YgaU
MLGRSPTAARASDAVSLRVLIAFLVLFGIGLRVIVGLPHLPDSSLYLPDPASLEAMLRSAHPPLDGAIYVAGSLGWLIWAWLVLSLGLQVIAATAERVAAGANVVRQVRITADFLSAPLVRRAVQTSLAGGMVLRVAMAGVPTAAAAPRDPAPIVTVVGVQHATTAASSEPSSVWFSSQVRATDIPAGSIIYTVQPGENLAIIAERIYGDGNKWTVLYEANQNRRMRDGAIFDRAGVIHPGWELIAPDPDGPIHFDDDGQCWYTVQRDDSLAGISARLGGDERRWPELFAANDGARHPDGHVLTDPRIIWKDLALRVPWLDREPAPAVEEAPEPAPEMVDTRPVAEAPVQTPPPTPTPDVSQQPPTPAPAVAMPTAAPEAIATEVDIATEVAGPEPTSVPLEPSAPAIVSSPAENIPPWAPEAAGAAAGVALIGLGLAGARRTRRRRSPWDETDIQVVGGFAQATGDETMYDGQATSLANQVLAFAREHGCSSIQLHGVYAGRTGAGLVLSVTPEQAEQFAVAAAAFGSNSKSVRLKPTDDGDYQWEQAWSSVRPRRVAEAEDEHVRLVPIGLAGDRRVLYANSSATGALLVAGRASAGVHDLLATLVVDRARRQRADELYALTIASPTRLEPLLAELPHQRAGFVDSGDQPSVVDMLAELRREVERRIEHGQGDSPDLLLVVDEVAELAEQGPVFDLLARHGPSVGVSILAATTHVDDASIEQWVGLFGTRLVLQTPDEASSTRLIGEGGAEDLDAIGQLWPWVQGRQLHRVRGFRIPPVHLADLVERMRERADGDPHHAAAQFAQDAVFGPDTASRDTPASSEAAPAADDVSEPDDPRAAPVGGEAPWPDGAEWSDTTAVPTASVPSPATHRTPPSTTSNGAAHQIPLIGAVALSSRPDPVVDNAAAEPLVDLRLFGHQTSLVRGQESTQLQHNTALRKYRRGWSLLLAIAALPDTKASVTRIGELLWQQAGDDLDLLSNRIQSNLSNARQVLQAAGLTPDEARRVVRTEGGLCLFDRDQVRSDVWEFLDAQRAGNHARAAGREPDAIAAYQQARALYAGPLLAGQQATHPWTGERVDGGLTLVEAYHVQWRELTERLANLLAGTRTISEAASMYRELLLDPLALPSRDRDLVETREAHAHALFGCYRALADAAGLEQAFADLQLALEHDDKVGAATTPTRPTSQTRALLEEARRELRTHTGSSPSGRAGDPPAAAGD